jgi:hypothetical protein
MLLVQKNLKSCRCLAIDCVFADIVLLQTVVYFNFHPKIDPPSNRTNIERQHEIIADLKMSEESMKPTPFSPGPYSTWLKLKTLSREFVFFSPFRTLTRSFNCFCRESPWPSLLFFLPVQHYLSLSGWASRSIVKGTETNCISFRESVFGLTCKMFKDLHQAR